MITHQYNLTVSGPTVQLIDRTKPYQNEDAIKIGRRILRSDPSFVKYWLEDDISITKTTSGGHALNIAGHSNLTKSMLINDYLLTRSNYKKLFSNSFNSCRRELSCPRTIYEDELIKRKYSSQMWLVLPTFHNMHEWKNLFIRINRLNSNLVTSCGITCIPEIRVIESEDKTRHVFISTSES